MAEKQTGRFKMKKGAAAEAAAEERTFTRGGATYGGKISRWSEMFDLDKLQNAPEAQAGEEIPIPKVPELTPEEANHPLIKEIREEARKVVEKKKAEMKAAIAETEGEAPAAKAAPRTAKTKSGRTIYLKSTEPKAASSETDLEKQIESKKAAERARLAAESDAESARKTAVVENLDKQIGSQAKQGETMAKKKTTTVKATAKPVTGGEDVVNLDTPSPTAPKTTPAATTPTQASAVAKAKDVLKSLKEGEQPTKGDYVRSRTTMGGERVSDMGGPYKTRARAVTFQHPFGIDRDTTAAVAGSSGQSQPSPAYKRAERGLKTVAKAKDVLKTVTDSKPARKGPMDWVAGRNVMDRFPPVTEDKSGVMKGSTGQSQPSPAYKRAERGLKTVAKAKDALAAEYKGLAPREGAHDEGRYAGKEARRFNQKVEAKLTTARGAVAGKPTSSVEARTFPNQKGEIAPAKGSIDLLKHKDVVSTERRGPGRVTPATLEDQVREIAKRKGTSERVTQDVLSGLRGERKPYQVESVESRLARHAPKAAAGAAGVAGAKEAIRAAASGASKASVASRAISGVARVGGPVLGVVGTALSLASIKEAGGEAAQAVSEAMKASREKAGSEAKYGTVERAQATRHAKEAIRQGAKAEAANSQLAKGLGADKIANFGKGATEAAVPASAAPKANTVSSAKAAVREVSGVNAPAKSFSEAFKTARKGGAKSFEYGGKSYHTRVKGEAAPKLSKFGEAFKSARSGGAASFEYEGKKYTTKLKGE